MAYDIIIGRNESDRKLFGSRGLIFLGKGYVKMGTYTSLSNKIWLDIARSHVILVAGKRGSGKSYTLGVIAEGLSDLHGEEAANVAPLIFDTMGIFWTMKYKNEKDRALLDEWELKTKELPVRVFIPFGKEKEYREKLIPFDELFALKVSELGAEDWLGLFNLPITSPEGVLLERVVTRMKLSAESYTIAEMQEAVDSDDRASKQTKDVVAALLYAADSWGIFSREKSGTEIEELITPGTTTVLDISVYSSSTLFNIRALVIGLLSKKIFTLRMDARKKEELESLLHGTDYLAHSGEEPLVWIFIDEAHEFLPKVGKTPATDALVQLLREGRQPGISLVLATQQPGQIHGDVMTQSDIVISHRVTAKPDIDALNEIMQTYLLKSIKQQIDDLPRLRGSAIILDDNSERIYPIRVRPRFTWHGGEAPTAIKAQMSL